MFFDILIIVIIALCAVFGFRAGFLISLTRLIGWVGAVVIAFFYHKDVEVWVLEHTDWFEKLSERIHTICDNFVALYTNDVTGNLPSGLSQAASGAGNTLAAEMAVKITDHAYTILVFVGIIFGIKIVLFVATLLLSKKFHGGFLGFIDGFVGLLLGLFSSIVAILVAFAFIMPLSYSWNTNAYMFIQDQM
ncbi:MAG: CvpA family protein, partial [Clostridiales Family XIII bacterium]|nr:CvpA family protein [Clostridiales Family XIII bacterium]